MFDCLLDLCPCTAMRLFFVIWHLGQDHIDIIYMRLHFQSDI